MTALVVDAVSKSYREPLFSDISFSLESGGGLGISGSNGSGKTTLLDMLAGLIKPDSGTIHTSGHVGYAPQNDGLSGRLSCIDNLRFFAALAGMDRKTACLRIEECAGICRLESFLNKRLSKCSVGMRQRVSVAAALLSNPPLLLLDEVFSPLDAASREVLYAALAGLKRTGVSIILVSHSSTDFHGLCERVMELPSGDIRELSK